GADPDEGLDLQGNFTYAVNFGTTGASGRAGDAAFSADSALGVTFNAPNEVTAWLTASYGDSPADDVLEKVMGDIRWAPAPDTVVVRLAVETGIKYKLQLLFAESCCVNRGFNVKLDGVLAAPDFGPGVTQQEVGTLATIGAVITEEFTAASETYIIELDGPGAENPDFGDRNAILNGFTLERLSAVGDLDGDGLRDDWEKRYFGNTEAKPTDDADADGLTNAEELALDTQPTAKDSDQDGLEDGAEVRVHHTSPVLVDSDGDRLSDGREVNELRSDPNKTDSDGDGAGDLAEVIVATNPANASSLPRRVMVGSFFGGDPGEGLDLQGTFVHALNVGGADATTAGDASFAPLSDADSVPDVTFEAGNQVASWHLPDYGDSTHDDGLELAMQSIRWSNAGSAIPAVLLTFDNLEVGADYKAQFLIAEQCCAGRAFDVFHDGALLADEFNPSIFQGGAGRTGTGAVVTVSFFARQTSTTFSLDGRSITTPTYTDHNAILNAVTLEKVSPRTDTDGDTLPDGWEQEFLGGLTQNASADTDGDGLPNSEEFSGNTNPALADSDGDGLSDGEEKAAGTIARNADSDGDGLTDGAELKTHHSNPLASDTDGDRISDFVEVTQRETNPSKRDTDDDTFDDFTEILSGSNPLLASSKPIFTRVGSFTGGDVGEGLDLDGTFLYALNIGGPDGAQVRDANFVPATAADTVEGAEIITQSEVQAWHSPAYGDSANDDALETVLLSIRYSSAPAKPTIRLANLVPGRAYQLQLLVAESCCDRGYDVVVNGQTIVDDLPLPLVQGGINNTAAGVVVSHRFKAASATLEVILDGPAAPFPDHNATLSGLTLEDLGPAGPEYNAATPLQLAAPTVTAGNLNLSWSGGGAGPYTLERKASLSDAAWTPVAQVSVRSASLPLDSASASGFFRIRE
ncbi:MAG: hypothetical protein IT580_01475, partial [Verrucomicrobiales bacterium]|nr:hypothetical protein [Verrucomicrobiales bacterium]